MRMACGQNRRIGKDWRFRKRPSVASTCQRIATKQLRALRRPGDTRACGRIVSTLVPKREVTCMQASNPTTSAVSAGRKPRDDEIDVFGLTHPGKVRHENQDHFLISSLHKQIQVRLTSLPTSELLSQHTERLAFLAMVADGVGGAAGGEEASRLAVGAITRYVTQAIHCYYSEDAMDEQRFPRALESAALRVHEDIQRNRPTGPLQPYMATTLTLWIGVWPRAYLDRKSTRLNSSHANISYAVFCLKKKKTNN